MHVTPCRCGRTRQRGQYLCRGCWYRLSAITRKRLSTRDSKAFLRLRELNRQLDEGKPLPDMEVSA
ncbi:hypothetical protein QFZ75_003655 [Streptomyces sp. V3I8]|uniref:hypothetical protein n=1 Tax=Streptomyces sp. V3I8 TaxID=3042279 RepID=UPI002780CACB|nr:hypothetical protein [Streptomyces sp. V3I8]MDQ1037239.1 hypothetical protein [Streptomyces sp. V3I8]